MTVVVGDLGASNARLAVYKNGRLCDVCQFACDDFKTPQSLIQAFIMMYAPDTKYVMLGVPGAVYKNQVKWTNRSWHLSGDKLKKQLKLRQVILMNDLAVQGVALSELKMADFAFLQKGRADAGPKVLVNVGTGLGACFVVNGDVYSAEYGQTMIGGCTLEQSVSGPGFKKIYQKNTKIRKPVSAVKIEMDCMQGDAKARKTYADFYKLLGVALMNMALTLKATGGVYVCGGILDEKTLRQMNISETFADHPKMKSLLKQVPLVYIKRKDFAFLGLKKLVRKFGWS
ncbi:MAG: ROK family protein [Alphaproteobacteria bacterium]|nr:ROK family protein [Alphaproteobacteria bacterium]